MKTASLILSLAALTGSQLFASVSVQLSAPASTIAVGETLVFTASARDSTNSSAQFTYQFTYRTSGSGPYTVLQDYYSTNTFPWTPADHEGRFDVGVTAKSSTGASAATIETVFVTSRVTEGRPVISATKNALVALYSAPPCNSPGQVRVRFSQSALSNNHAQFTPLKPCNGLSVNFFIAGMAPNSTYVMQQDLFDGSVTSGPQLTWRTGAIPSSFRIPSHFKIEGPAAPTSVSYPFLLRSSLSFTPFATDLNENVVWYAGWAEGNDTGLMTHLISGGTFLYLQDNFLREADLAGNVIRESNWPVLDWELNNLRRPQGKSLVHLDQLSHEGIRLPNGYTATLVTDEEIKDQGAGPTLVLGDVVAVLDQNMQTVWSWNAFDYFNVRRLPVVTPATCVSGQGGCPAKLNTVDPRTNKPFASANDWTHANAISYDPRDGNLIVSFRNQSWVIKIAYQNGTGDGHIIWTLGFGGSFHLASGYPVSDWFSGQHNPSFQSNGLLTLFDNNNPSAATEQPGNISRGQAWQLDTTHMIATPVVNFDLGSYSLAIGSATLLSNGNYEFNSGFIGTDETQISEFTPSGSLVYKEQTNSQTYRSFRIRDFYTP